MLNSANFNLTNPAFTEDIGETYLNQMLLSPNSNYIPGISGTINGKNMKGKLDKDKVELSSQKEKDQKVWNKIFKGILAIGVITLGVKFGKPLLSKAWNGIKNLYTKIKN